MPIISPDIAEYDLDIPAGRDFVHEIVWAKDATGAYVNLTGATFAATLYEKGVALANPVPTMVVVDITKTNVRLKLTAAQTAASLLPLSGRYAIDYTLGGLTYPLARGHFFRS